MKKRTMIKYGFAAFNGIVWTREQVDEYNSYQKLMNQYVIENREIPMELLNGSHNLFCIFSEIYQ